MKRVWAPNASKAHLLRILRIFKLCSEPAPAQAGGKHFGAKVLGRNRPRSRPAENALVLCCEETSQRQPFQRTRPPVYSPH